MLAHARRFCADRGQRRGIVDSDGFDQNLRGPARRTPSRGRPIGGTVAARAQAFPPQRRSRMIAAIRTHTPRRWLAPLALIVALTVAAPALAQVPTYQHTLSAGTKIQR